MKLLVSFFYFLPPVVALLMTMGFWIFQQVADGHSAQVVIYTLGIVFGAGVISNEIRTMRKTMVTKESLEISLLNFKEDLRLTFQTKEACEQAKARAAAASASPYWKS